MPVNTVMAFPIKSPASFSDSPSSFFEVVWLDHAGLICVNQSLAFPLKSDLLGNWLDQFLGEGVKSPLLPYPTTLGKKRTGFSAILASQRIVAHNHLFAGKAEARPAARGLGLRGGVSSVRRDPRRRRHIGF